MELSRLNAVLKHLHLMLAHFLKVHFWPDSASRDHWRGEIAFFQTVRGATVCPVNAATDRFGASLQWRVGTTRQYQPRRCRSACMATGLSNHAGPTTE